MGADDWSSNAQTISNPHTRSLGLDYPEGQYNTLEMLPNENNYAIQDDLQGLRPSVLTIVEGDKVHDDDMFQARKAASEQQRSELKEKQRQRRFGTYNGVVVRCLLNIWGVIMFLRMGWVVGHAGVWHSTLIIGIALLNSILTSLSMSAICTNGEVSGGGAYFLISRTLGPAFGGSIGLIFSVANMVAASLYVVGFAETLVGTFHSDDFHLVGDGSWDLRIYAIIALFLLFGLCLVGVGWVVKIDVFQLCLLITGICMFFLGTFINSSDADIGFTGFSSTTFSDNWGPAYKDGESMVSVFAVFFPAVTGMMAGANISGDLKNPQVSIPRGTLISVVLSISVYMIIAWVLAATCLRVAPDGGLYDDSLLMITISLWKPIVVAGVFASTLSSALASLVGAPRILKAVCEDKLIPALNFFAVGRESDNEPVRAYVLTLVVSFCIILIGDLNAIAELITNFFLFNRALVNYACFSMAISRSPGWRPTFKYYHWSLALFCCLMSLLLMFAISWLTAIVTISFYILLYKYIDHIEPEVNWGSAHQAQAYYAAASQMSKLQHIKKHIKTWRPSYLILGKAAEAKKQLFTLATQLRKGYGFVFVGDIQIGDIRTVIKQGNYYPPNGSSSSSSSSPSLHPAAGASTAASPSNAGRAIASNGDISMSVIGPQEFGIDITPAPARRTRAESYSVSTNNYSHWHAGHMGSTGSAFSCPVDEHSSSTAGQAGSDAKDSTFDIFTMVREANMFAEVERIVAPSFGDGMLTLLQTAGTAALRPNTTLFPFPYCPSVRPAGELEVLYEAMRNCVLLRYGIGMLHGSVENRPRKPDGTIDVWWLADTGGLILLLAHLLREHDSWKGCEIRVFVNQSKNGPKDMKPMVTLLKKFRIKITHVENINLNAVPFSSSGTYLEEDASFGGYRRDADANNNDKFARNGSRLSDLFSRVETHDSIATSPLHGSSSSIEKKATASQDKLLGYELSNLNLADMQESSDIQRMDSGDSSYSFSRKASEDAAQMTLSIHNNPALSAAPSSSVSASASASGAPQTIHEHVKNSASAGAESAESAKSLDPASSGDEIECKLSDPASHNLLTPNVSHPELADEDSALMSPDKSPSQVCHTLGAQETKSGEELAKERRRRDKKKLQHYLRVGQCVRRRSKNAEMIFVTLPGPSRKRTPDTYFSWLEAIVRPVDVLKRLKNSKGEKALEKQQKMKEEQEQENSGETKKSSQSNEEKKNNNVRFQGHDENNDSNTTSTTTTTTADVNDNQDTNTNADADATSDNLDSHLCYGPKADTDMPPIILVRGSQENVLSYYS